METLSRERSPAEVKQALDACSALVTPDTSARVTHTLLKILPQLDGDMQIEADRGTRPLDRVAARILGQANRGADFYRMWQQEFDAADEEWRSRLWQVLYLNAPGSAEAMKPFIVWSHRRLQTLGSGNQTEDYHSLKAAEHLRNSCGQATFGNDAEFVGRVHGLLASIPQLDRAWWLSHPLVHRAEVPGSPDADTNLWPPRIRGEIVRNAVAALQDRSTEPALVAQACSILTHGADPTPQQRTVILAAIAERLSAAGPELDALSDIVQTNEAFAKYNVAVSSNLQRVGKGKSLQLNAPVLYQRRESGSMQCLLLEILSVIETLDGETKRRPQLDHLLNHIEGTLVRVISQRDSNRREPVVLEWPALTIFDRRPTNRHTFEVWCDLGIDTRFLYSPQAAELNARRVVQVWGEYQPAPRDWLQYLVLLHPVMQDPVAARIAERI